VFQISRAIVKELSSRPVSAESPFRSPAISCEIYVGRSNSDSGFCQCSSVFTCRYHSTNAAHSPSATSYRHQKDKSERSRKILQNKSLSGNRPELDRKVLSLFLVFRRLLFFTPSKLCLLVLSYKLVPALPTCTNPGGTLPLPGVTHSVIQSTPQSIRMCNRLSLTSLPSKGNEVKRSLQKYGRPLRAVRGRSSQNF